MVSPPGIVVQVTDETGLKTFYQVLIRDPGWGTPEEMAFRVETLIRVGMQGIQPMPHHCH